MRSRRHASSLTVTAALAAIAIVIAGCGSSTGSSSNSSPSGGNGTPGPNNAVAVSYLSDYVANGVLAPLLYGKSKGYYAAQGIDLKITYGTGSSTTVQQVASGQADIGDAFSGSIAQGVSKGASLKAVGFFRANGAFAFFCDKKLNINSFSQLKGHSVIIPPGTVQAALYPGVLKAAGLAATDIKVDSVSAASAGANFASGQSDCITTTLGDAPTFETTRPVTTLEWSQGGFAVPGFAFFVTSSYLEAHPQLIAGFLKATYQSIAESLQDPGAAVAAFNAANPQSNPKLTAAQFAASHTVYCSTDMAKQSSPLGFQLPTAFSTIVDQLKTYESLPASVSAASLYTNQFFKENNVSSTKCSADIAS